MALILKKWGYLHSERAFCYNVLSFSVFIKTFFWWFALKIEFVVFVYELFNYEIIFYYLGV